MRIVVTSDVHRRRNTLYNIIDRHIDNADLFINLGDSAEDIENIPFIYPDIRMECVAGNCDFGSTLELYKTINFCKKKVFITHGHAFYVKHGYERLKERAKQEGADICLFGHTHTPYINNEGGIYYMNPGAVCDRSYGIIDIENGKIFGYTNKI